MHPIISADMKKARVAEFHRQADQDRLVRTARRGLGRRRWHIGSALDRVALWQLVLGKAVKNVLRLRQPDSAKS